MRVAPRSVCALTTITGTSMLARDLAQHFDAVHARHVQIERHHVRAKFGDLFQPDSPSIAVPTTSIDGSWSKTWGISFRMSAESSTTRTRIFAFRSCRCSHRWDVAKDARSPRGRSGSAPRFHRPGSKRRSPRADVTRLIFQRLDDQFFFAHQTIHSEAESAAPAPMTTTKDVAFARCAVAWRSIRGDPDG